MDMIPRGEKGRLMGQHNGNARWSDAAVERMRDLKEFGGKTNAEICKEFNIPKSTLSGILSYKHRAVTPTKWKPKKGKKDGNNT